MKVALIGAGGIGQAHSNAYLQLPNARITAVVDLRLEKAQAIADQHGAKVYPTVEKMFKAEQVDMVDICTPSDTHKEIALLCLQHKTHVLCEKPIAHTLRDAQAIIRAVQKSDRYLMIAQVIRFWPEYQYLKKIHEDQTYGPLRVVHFSRTCGAPTWSWENWYLDRRHSGMAPFELHIHDADYIHYLLGLPAKVQSFLYEKDDLFFSHIKTRYFYPNPEVLVEADAGWYKGTLPFSATFRAVFEGAVLDYQGNKLMVYPAEGEGYQADMSTQVQVAAHINIQSLVGIYHEIAYFVQCIQNHQPPRVITPQDSYNSLKMLLAEIRSAKTGRIVRI